jgi:ferredoxin
MRIVINRDKCAGLGMCEGEAPSLFEVQDNSTVHVLEASPAPEQVEEARAAVVACPTGALSIVDDV